MRSMNKILCAVDLWSNHDSGSTEGPSGGSESSSVESLSLPDISGGEQFKRRNDFPLDESYAAYVKDHIKAGDLYFI